MRTTNLMMLPVRISLLWPLPNGAFLGPMKETMTNKYSNKHNWVKDPSWREADQLAIYKRRREVELGDT